jgi:hypothetical protein
MTVRKPPALKRCTGTALEAIVWQSRLPPQRLAGLFAPSPGRTSRMSGYVRMICEAGEIHLVAPHRSGTRHRLPPSVPRGVQRVTRRMATLMDSVATCL